MLHEISDFDLLNIISETPPKAPDTTDDPQDSDILLVHATSIRPYISPVDIRKILSSINIPHK